MMVICHLTVALYWRGRGYVRRKAGERKVAMSNANSGDSFSIGPGPVVFEEVIDELECCPCKV